MITSITFITNYFHYYITVITVITIITFLLNLEMWQAEARRILTTVAAVAAPIWSCARKCLPPKRTVSRST